MVRQSRPKDAEIQRIVEEILQADSRVDSTGIQVRVQQGAVHLHGFVPSVEQRTAAQRIVEHIKGVRDVLNQLEVEPTVRRSDVDITADVVAALTVDDLVDERKIEVTAADGVVYLRGTVGSHSERRAADDDARSVPGVVDVIDEILVAVPRTSSDAALAADLRHELRRNLCLGEPAVHVEVTHGVAHLQGNVVALPQRWMAEELARFTAGVVDVVNDLTVAPEEGS